MIKLSLDRNRLVILLVSFGVFIFLWYLIGRYRSIVTGVEYTCKDPEAKKSRVELEALGISKAHKLAFVREDYQGIVETVFLGYPLAEKIEGLDESEWPSVLSLWEKSFSPNGNWAVSLHYHENSGASLWLHDLKSETISESRLRGWETLCKPQWLSNDLVVLVHEEEGLVKYDPFSETIKKVIVPGYCRALAVLDENTLLVQSARFADVEADFTQIHRLDIESGQINKFYENGTIEWPIRISPDKRFLACPSLYDPSYKGGIRVGRVHPTSLCIINVETQLFSYWAIKESGWNTQQDIKVRDFVWLPLDSEGKVGIIEAEKVGREN